MGAGFADVFGPPADWPRARPLNFVDAGDPPFLLVHGTGDRRVDSRQSERMAAALRAAGVPVELLRLPGGSHDAPLWGFYAPERQPAVLPRVRDFLQGSP